MVGVLDVDAELLQRDDGLAADVGARVQRGEVEVAALVEDLGAVLVAEQEVLQLRTDVEGVEAELVHALQRAAQHVPRIALVGRALGREDVAEDASDALLPRAPREDREGRRVRHGHHVGLLDGVEPEADEPQLMLVDERLDVLHGPGRVTHCRDPRGSRVSRWSEAERRCVEAAACLARSTGVRTCGPSQRRAGTRCRSPACRAGRGRSWPCSARSSMRTEPTRRRRRPGVFTEFRFDP